MKTLKDFTPEIQSKIPEYIKKYLSGVFREGMLKNHGNGYFSTDKTVIKEVIKTSASGSVKILREETNTNLFLKTPLTAQDCRLYTKDEVIELIGKCYNDIFEVENYKKRRFVLENWIAEHLK